jgi:hypothetical protein
LALQVFTLPAWRGTEDPAQEWLVDALGDLIAELREQLRDAPRPERVALVLTEPAGTTAQERAVVAGAAEALRGIAQSLTLELAPGTRVNAVLCTEDRGPDEALALLEGPDGGFLAGATLDLRVPA